MKRLLFPAFVVAAGLLAAAACDPKLDIQTVPGEGGSEASAFDSAPPPPAEDAGPTPEAGDPETGTSDSGITHKVDGVNDFLPAEKLETTSSHPVAPGVPYYAYAAWDAKNVYFGMEGPDVASNAANASNKWVMLYLGPDAVAGSSTGLTYGSTTPQQPTLPFSASIHLRWKVDGLYTNVQQWTGGAWAPAALALTVVRQGTFVEMGISRAALGSPAKLRVVMNMLIENSSPNDWTYAGVPSTTFSPDRLNPPFTKYYEFDLTDLAKAPNTYAPLP
jgi:hypothetical protein